LLKRRRKRNELIGQIFNHQENLRALLTVIELEMDAPVPNKYLLDHLQISMDSEVFICESLERALDRVNQTRLLTCFIASY